MKIRIFDYTEEIFPLVTEFLPTEIHLWKINCEEYTCSEEALHLLDSKEKIQFHQYQKALDRLHYLLGHSITKKILASYTGFPADKIIFSRREHGKPYWENPHGVPAIEFSISHSGHWVLLAFSRDYHLGIDVEEAKITPRLPHIARRFLHPYEWETYQSLPESKQVDFFYRHWTSKEAVLKGIGTGLTHSTTTFYIEETPSISDESTFCVRSPEAVFHPWRVAHIPLTETYVVTLAFALKNDFIGNAHS